MTRDWITSWMGPIGVGIVTATIGGLVGGWLATRAVHRYHVPSREGGAGYFVLFQALFAIGVGFIVGVVINRPVLSGGGTQSRARLMAGEAHLALLAVFGGVARLMADVPPSFEGERLLLAVEFSWPDAQAPKLPSGDILPYVGLSSLSGNAVRVGQQGPLWVEVARR